MNSKHEVKQQGQFLFKLNHYLRYGYHYYYARTIPSHKTAADIDRKLVLLYDVTFNRNTRAARKKKGVRNIIYFRYQQQFILLSSDGVHPAFDRLSYVSFQETPFRFYGYSVMVKGDTPSIKIEAKRYQMLRKKAALIALYRYERVEEFLLGVSPFSFRGVNQQRWKLYQLINQKRKAAGLKRIQWDEVKGK
jgi:hypothetical protein